MNSEDKDLTHAIVSGILATIGLAFVMITVLPSLLHAVLM